MIYIPLEEHNQFVKSVLKYSSDEFHGNPEFLLNLITIACHEELSRSKVAVKPVKGTVTNEN